MPPYLHPPGWCFEYFIPCIYPPRKAFFYFNFALSPLKLICEHLICRFNRFRVDPGCNWWDYNYIKNTSFTSTAHITVVFLSCHVICKSNGRAKMQAVFFPPRPSTIAFRINSRVQCYQGDTSSYFLFLSFYRSFFLFLLSQSKLTWRSGGCRSREHGFAEAIGKHGSTDVLE